MFLFWNRNTWLIRKEFRRRHRDYWDNVDAFGGNPTPPDEAKQIPVILLDGTVYVDLYTAFGFDAERHAALKEAFEKQVKNLNPASPATPVRGVLEKMRGNHAVIKMFVHELPYPYLHIHSQRLVLVQSPNVKH